MADVQPGREAREDRAAANTDRELWRGEHDVSDYYADSVHVTMDGRIGLNVGGRGWEMTPSAWISLADREAALIREIEGMTQALETMRRAGLHGVGARERLRRERDKAVAQVAALTEALRETKDVLRHKNVAPLITDGLAGTLERFLADVPEAGRKLLADHEADKKAAGWALLRLADAEETLRAAGERQREALAICEKHGFVFDKIGSEPGNWQHLAFTLYTLLCETENDARLYSERHESPAGTPEDTPPTKGTVI
jgi:hypothetical protein